ncbi:hypothetical protein SCUCBS95973_001401 [Sporothrix curviconia]|uniref:Cytochrome b5 heme-binding domain-containing protein n=1 Tax=Sporothrix curviconia TaxID=1260050 RepID=A0ABP0AYH9_9PEZI
MGVIGITLVLASIVLFLMYPQTWRSLAQPVLQWWQAEDRPASEAGPDAAAPKTAPKTAPNTTATAETIPDEQASTTIQSNIERDRVAMPPPPPPPPIIHILGDNAKQTEDEDEDEEEATTPKAVPTLVQNGTAVPSLSLSAPGDSDGEDAGDGDGDDCDKMPPPMFPSPFSAQRAGASSDPSRAPSSSSSSPAGLMAPPPRPQPRAAPGAAAASSLSALNAARRPANLPIPNRGPPLRNPPATGFLLASSSLVPPPSSTAKPNKPSRKVVLEPGHSPLDWARVTADPTGNRLRGNLPADAPYLLRVTPSQLKQMNGRKGRDAWTALGGMVYNITPYVPFHPGGKGELLRCAGKDGNRLFNEVHSWVNYDNMLSACRIGIMVEEHASTTSPMEEMD